jgi:hypothetical protein
VVGLPCISTDGKLAGWLAEGVGVGGTGMGCPGSTFPDNGQCASVPFPSASGEAESTGIATSKQQHHHWVQAALQGDAGGSSG